MTKQEVELSKFCAYALRHRPDAVGLTLDGQGWAEVDALVACAVREGYVADRDRIERIVREDKKGRYALSADGTHIRARQGHSVDVDVGMPVLTPPAVLYHGTAQESLASIRAKGILRMERNYVHLSQDKATAREVGVRHGTPVVLVIDAARMVADGVTFRLSENGVWQVDTVAWHYVTDVI